LSRAEWNVNPETQTLPQSSFFHCFQATMVLHRWNVLSAAVKWVAWKAGFSEWTVGVHDDLEIHLFSWTIVGWYRSEEKVKQVLMNKDSVLAWPYEAFSNVLRQNESIATEKCVDEEWRLKHQALALAIARVKWDEPLKKYENQFFIEALETRRLDKAWQKYLGYVWFSSCFAVHDDRQMDRIWDIRQRLNQELRNRFFGCWYWKVPVIGPWLAKRWALPFRLLNEPGCLPFKGWLDEVERTVSVPFAEESAVLSFLVFEFLYEKGLEVLLHTMRDPTTRCNWQILIPPAFFYPWRLRWVGNTVAVLNLVATQMYWSAGPRACVGQNVARAIFKHATDLILSRKPFVWRMVTSRVNRLPGDRPLAISPVSVELTCSRALTLPFIRNFTLGRNLFHVNSIFFRPPLVSYIHDRFCRSIRQQWNILDKLVIVCPETRGWLLASPVAATFHCPLVPIRKGGKEKGTAVFSQSYSTVYSQGECLEVSQNAPIFADSQVVVIDDGFASGGSLNATINLVKRFGAQVGLVLCVFHHHDGKAPDYVNDVTNTGLKQMEFSTHPETDVYTLFDTYQAAPPKHEVLLGGGLSPVHQG